MMIGNHHDVDIESHIRIEDLFGDEEAVAFGRNQTAKGYDNTKFCVYLEQKKSLDFFRKNKGKTNFDSLEVELTGKGFIPKYSEKTLYNPFHTVVPEIDRPTASTYKNSRLALELAKMGVWYNHPLLNKDLCEASYDVMAYIYKPDLPIPMDGYKSCEITESNIALIDYCLKTHGSHPKLKMESYDALWLALGFKGEPDLIERIKTQFGCESFEDFLIAFNYIFDECQAKKRSELAKLSEARLAEKKEQRDSPERIPMTAYLCYAPPGSLRAEKDDEGNYIRTERILSFPTNFSSITCYELIRNLGLSCQALDDEFDVESVDMEGDNLFAEAGEGDY
jgi:hypothetical protein